MHKQWSTAITVSQSVALRCILRDPQASHEMHALVSRILITRGRFQYIQFLQSTFDTPEKASVRLGMTNYRTLPVAWQLVGPHRYLGTDEMIHLICKLENILQHHYETNRKSNGLPFPVRCSSHAP